MTRIPAARTGHHWFPTIAGRIRTTRGLCRFLTDMPNRLDISKRIAVVIGGTSGIGRALVLGLAEHGATVVPSGRREDRIAEVCAAIEAAGGTTLRHAADVNSRASLDALR